MSIKKPSDKEQEYFAKIEADRRKKEEEERERSEKERARIRRRDLHHMKCPKCGGDLATITHHEVEIDRCTECRGIWLDAGELEQLVSREEGVLRKILRLVSPQPPGPSQTHQ